MHQYPRTVAAIAASSLLIAFAAQAGKGANYHKHDDGKKFTLTGGATYLQAPTNSTDYVSIVSEDAAANVSSKVHDLDPEFNWGYFLGFGYMISDNYDVQATWQQLNATSSDSTSAVGAVPGVRGFNPANGAFVTLNPGDTLSAHTSETVKYQAFDANLGIYHQFTESLSSRIFAGLRYAKIDSDIDNTYATDTTAAGTFTENFDSSFSGVGPTAGMDLEYEIWDTIAIVGGFSAAFLVGDLESKNSVFEDFGLPNNSNKTTSNTRIIPALSGKLGAKYEIPYSMNDWSFGVEAGYKVDYYFNAVDQLLTPASTGTLDHRTTDLGMMGPYLNFSAMF